MQYFVTGSKDKTSFLWKIGDLLPKMKFIGHSDSVTCVAITKDRSQVITGSLDKSIIKFNT
jgi:NACHT domain- and WD repeat-containing protein